MKQIFLVIVMASICISGGLFSEKPPSPIKRSYTYQIDHRNNEVKILKGISTPAKESWDLEMENPWEISVNTKIRIVISNPNPFYFNYQLGEVKKEEIENFTELDEFLKELDNVYKEFEKLKPANFKRTADEMSGLPNFKLKASIQKRFESIEKDVNDVITRIRKNLKTAKNYARTIPESIKSTLNATKEKIKKLIDEVNSTTTIDIDNIQREIKEDYEKIDKYQLKFIEQMEQSSEGIPAGYLQSQLLITSILKNQEARIKKLVKILVMFKENCNKLVGKIQLYELTYDKKNKQIIPIQISYIDKKKYEADVNGVQFLNGEPKVGEIKLIFTPRQFFEFKFSVNGIYTSIKETEDEGEEEEKSRIMDIPALTIIPGRLLKGEKIDLGFQIGATLKSETINTIFGLGIVFAKRLFVGGGLHLQIPKSEDLKPGYYFSIGLLVN